MLKGGADHNALNYTNDNPLHYAMTQSHLESAELLLKAGTICTQVNNYGKTPI